jgi:microcystin-dependent protein
MAAGAVFPSMQTIQVDGNVQYTARVYIFEPGTLTPKPSFTTAALSVQHAHPVLVNGVGRFPAIWLPTGNYRAQIKTDAGTLLEDYDNLQGGPPDAPVTPVIPPAGTVVPTGFEMVAEFDAPVTGWVRANGRSIGSAASGATELASATCEALFLQRWNKLPALTVGGGRGVSAAADWLAGKTIPLPDARGRTIVGRDAMGSSIAGIITAAVCANPDEAGFAFGAQTIALVEANNGPHAHTASTNTVGNHQHAGSVTDVLGDHVHSYTYATYTAEATTTPTGPGRQSFVSVSNNTGGAGAHGHNLLLVGDGSHSHTVTVNSSGSGTAHANAQPSRLVTVYIKL